MTLFTFIEILGTLAFAISGIRLASAKRFDWFGAYVVGFTTAIGGGTLRDLMLSLTPFWMLDSSYLVVTAFALGIVVVYGRYLIRLNNTFFIFDAIGLGLFTVVGVEKTLGAGFPLWVAVIMGTITGAAGGVLRDILINEEPLIFRKEIYALACVFANGTKPYINLLWVVLPFVVRRSEWKVRFSRAVYAVLTAAGALALTFGVEQYGTLLRHNYGAIARQGGATVNGGAQLLFVLKNPLRYIAVLLGTLYENNGFIGQLGLFGWKDMPVAFISLTAPLVLLLAAMLCTPAADALGRRRTGWLGVFGLVYAVGAMSAMYITYTPVAMVRIVGLQTRYFLPVWLLVVVAAAALARRALAPRLTAEKAAALAVPLCGWYAFAGAVLLFQHYFVGPVYTIYK